MADKAFDKSSIIKEAQRFLAKGQIDKAIAEWEKLLQSSPDPNTYNVIGDLHVKKGDKQKAIEQFHKAAEIFRQEGFSLKALAIYKKILNVNPAEPRALYALGELNEEKNIITDAIKYYLAAGDIYIKNNKKTEAVNTYGRIIKLAPGNLALRKKIAELYSKEGFVEETSREYVDMARIFIEEGDKAEGRRYLERALEIKPSNRLALTSLAEFCESEGETEEAAKWLKLAIERTGKSADVMLWLARLCLKAGGLEEARQYAAGLLDEDPNNIEARRIVGEICLREGDPEAAWKEYEPVLDELIFRGKFDEAIEILATFKEVEPIEARRKLVSFYKQKNDDASALREFKELGEVFEMSGMIAEAIGCYKEARSISPEDEHIRQKLQELEPPEEEEMSAGERAEKSIEEALSEADIFLGYGLYKEAGKILEGLKLRAPGNIELHLKLKSFYVETGDKEQAVTECIILSELYKRADAEQEHDAIVEEAFGINPSDPRLVERFGLRPLSEAREEGQVSEEAGRPGESVVGEPLPGPEIEEFDEELAEADFYMKQGFYDEAEAVYRNFINRFPRENSFRARLMEIEALRASAPAPELAPEEEAAEEVEQMQTLTLEDVIGAEDAQEPALDNGVLDIFNEFKKGLEKELEEEDTETHYNLGIAYKEMGLLDDAIREFQKVQHDPKLYIRATAMLGICYLAKGLYPLAIEAFQSALMKVDKKDEAQWGLKYDLAEAYEKNGDLKTAFTLYMEVYGWDSKFRGVSGKINALKESKEAKEKDKAKKSRVSYI